MYLQLDLDKGLKNQPINEADKNLALMKSDGKCEICGRKLTNENVRHDHVIPKSISSINGNALLCEKCNSQKSNLTPEKLASHSAYVERNKPVQPIEPTLFG